jgi:hypothetical protein
MSVYHRQVQGTIIKLMKITKSKGFEAMNSFDHHEMKQAIGKRLKDNPE